MKSFNLLIIVSFLLPICLQAQKKSRSEQRLYEKNVAYYKKVLGKKDADFDVVKAPAEWAEEPVVILCQKTYLNFSLGNMGYAAKGIIRKRVLIQDKAAIDNFSEFYYQDAAAIGIKHIKPNGKAKSINLDAGVTVETEVPRFYEDSYHSASYSKIAIPDLEVGDIIDYFKVFGELYPQINLMESISHEYPVLHQEIIVDAPEKFMGDFKSFNGAPEFVKKSKAGLDARGEKNKNRPLHRYIMTDTKREAEKLERWDFPYMTEPVYKAYLVNTTSIKQRDAIKKRKGVDIKGGLAATIKSGSRSGMMLEKTTEKRLRRIGIRKMKPKKQVTAIYNALRYEFLILSTSFKSSDQNIMRSLDDYYLMKSHVFAGLFADFLKKYGLECSVVAVVPRYFGGLSQAMTDKELEYGVYVPATKKYYWTVDNYRNMNDEYFDACGAEGYKLDRLLLDKSDKKFKKVSVPASDPTRNTSRTELDITINSDNSLKVKNTVQFMGRYKSNNSPVLLYQTNYMDDDFELLYPEKDKARIKKKRKKSTAKKSKKKNYQLKKEELGQKKTAAIERWLKQDFEIEELEDFGIISYGRIAKDEPLHVETNFSSKAYLQKAGPNLIFEIGKLISGQVALEEEEMKTRTKNVELGFARTIDNIIKVNLPEGYKAQGLETLDMNVDNAFAAFVSEATQTGNVLTVKTTKTYKQASIDKANWSSLVAMLEAAYKFSQQKIILKK